MAEQDTRTELNRLYWESDASVADIADRVGISRRALYDAIEPRSAGRCPDCGGPLGFRNRTAAERREAECGECGLQRTLKPEEPVREPRRGAEPADWWREPSVRSSGLVAGVALLIGIAVGAVAGYFLREN